MAADTASVVLADELWQSSGYADFDDISLSLGPCDATYAGADQHQTCSGDTPVCSADGSCQAVPPPPPADMSGGSPTPDMGATPSTPGTVSTFPGANQTLTGPTGTNPTMPTAATDPTTPPTASTKSSAGCSIGGSEGERSFAVMLLAFVAVMIAGRRRRA
jgi:hypothetical protein